MTLWILLDPALRGCFMACAQAKNAINAAAGVPEEGERGHKGSVVVLASVLALLASDALLDRPRCCVWLRSVLDKQAEVVCCICGDGTRLALALIVLLADLGWFVFWCRRHDGGQRDPVLRRLRPRRAPGDSRSLLSR